MKSFNEKNKTLLSKLFFQPGLLSMDNLRGQTLGSRGNVEKQYPSGHATAGVFNKQNISSMK